MIKKFCIFAFSVLGILLVACSEKPPIMGHLNATSGINQEIKVYLLRPMHILDVAASFKMIIVDSSEIDADGAFNFQLEISPNESHLYFLAVQNKDEQFPNRLENDSILKSNYFPVMLRSGESIELKANPLAFSETIEFVSPSDDNHELLQLRDTRSKAYRKFIEGKTWNVHVGSQLLDKEDALLKYQKALMNFASNTSSYIAAMVALRWASPKGDYERIPEILVEQCEKWKDVEGNFSEELCVLADKNLLPIILGDAFPMADLPLLTGERGNIKMLMGSKLTIIDLWASWCVPCRKENKEILVPLWDTFHDQGLQILAYGLENNEEAWKTAIEKDGADRWIHASHLEGDEAPFLKVLRIQTIPANYILDEKGTIIAKNLHGEALTTFIESYFQGT